MTSQQSFEQTWGLPLHVMSTVEALESFDAEFRLLIQRILQKDVSGAPVSSEAFSEALKRVEALVSELQGSEMDTAEGLKRDIERKRELHKKYSASMEQWKEELQQAVAKGEEVLMSPGE
jgi:hypothetical protein